MRACGNGIFDFDQFKVALVLVANKVFNSMSEENVYLLLDGFFLPLLQAKQTTDPENIEEEENEESK